MTETARKPTVINAADPDARITPPKIVATTLIQVDESRGQVTIGETELTGDNIGDETV